MVDREEELDRYLDEIKEHGRDVKQYARRAGPASSLMEPAGHRSCCWRSPAGS